MSEIQLIFGIHSIRAALDNPQRSHQKLIGTSEGIAEIFKGEYSKLKNQPLNIETHNLHKIQEVAKKYCTDLGFFYSRVPSGVFLVSDSLEVKEADWLYEFLGSQKEVRILALDGVSDIHNGAAIMRTACFYGVDVLIISGKGRFGFSPSLFRIASGAVEWLNIVQVQSLPKTLTKLKNKFDVQCLGLSEHSEEILSPSLIKGRDCLVMGTEDVGLSFAVTRVLDKNLGIPTQGKIKSLNVSVATAVCLEKCYGQV